MYEGVPKGTRVFGLAGTYHEEVAKELGLPFTPELYGSVDADMGATVLLLTKE